MVVSIQVVVTSGPLRHSGCSVGIRNLGRPRAPWPGQGGREARVQSDGPADRAGSSTAPSWATEGCTVKTCIPQNRFGVSTYLVCTYGGINPLCLQHTFHITSSARSDIGVLRGATWERGEGGLVNTTVLSPLSARFSKNRPLDRG
ncbi:uncharacterized protein P884DRAFT_276764 [Thermothelomyces heterothallicus CBS 202.75]|uniref:uncharacterized protein n=1 Tax=Thermothelomyces heterothallicus CBS 202.75 TaxID=1149848 RepID=UPI0037444E26